MFKFDFKIEECDEERKEIETNAGTNSGEYDQLCASAIFTFYIFDSIKNNKYRVKSIK